MQVKHKRTLYRFLLSKLEICNGNNEDRDSKHNRISIKMAEYTRIIPEINKILRSQGATTNYSGKFTKY